MSAAILAALALALPVQAPATVSTVPQRPGLTIVSAVAGDTYLGNSRGDYEMAVTVTSLSPAGTELTASSFVRNNAGKHEWLRFRRIVPASDLRMARTQVLGFATEDVATVPGTTSLGPSVLVMAEARQKGQVEFKVRNYADRRDNPGTLRRVGIDQLPVLLNGRRVALPAVHMRGQLGPAGHLRPWSFWFFDDPAQPITLKVSYGAEGAPETSAPEWLRQVIRIDVPDAAAGMGEVTQGPVAPGSPRGGVELAGPDGSLPTGDAMPPGGTGAGRPLAGREGAGGDGAGGAGTGAGNGGMGSGAGGLGAMAGMARDLTEVCRVAVPGVYFEFDSDELNPASAPWIGLVAEVLRRHPDWTVTIEGHTDSIGDPGYNQGLSVRRADALRRELVARHGIRAARLDAQGFGAARPLEPNTTLEGRARNRRVELVRPCGRADEGKPRKRDSA
ncbi:MAG TPA: OmpA family protein [Gemmatimonadales bacterium]|nr:OmpA family protein [Gemmatimonadales bacterium]